MVKTVLVYALLKERYIVYPIAIFVFLLLGGYQLYVFIHTPTILYPVLTVLDGAVVWLTAVEYRKQRLHAAYKCFPI